METIADFYLRKLITNPLFESPNPVDKQELLVPEFKAAWQQCIVDYQKKYPTQGITFTETYRSNTLQAIYYNQGASHVKKDGMHHYGIAGDTIFIIDGKRTYKGDINFIRKVYKDNGLTVIGMWDPLHVQFVAVADQPNLRAKVKATLIAFQQQYHLAQTGEVDAATIAKAKEIFG